ncbi:MAG TPA: hypothetical protein VFQ13_11300 [Anaerolineales bacterium]|nr:hypothetical protein [Anaerolineales bacterium]
MTSTSLKTFLKPGLAKIILTVTSFALSSYLWRIFIISTISDTFPWGFPLQFYLNWGPCPPGQICSESNLLFFVIDILFWYVGSALLILSFNRNPQDKP